MNATLISILAILIAASAANAADLEPGGPITVISHSWTALETNEALGKTRYLWQAIVRNDADEARKVCINYGLVNKDKRVVAQHEACAVPAAGYEIELGGQAYIDAQLVPTVVEGRAKLKEERTLFLPGSFQVGPPNAVPPPPKPFPTLPEIDNKVPEVVEGADYTILTHRWRFAERQVQFGTTRLIWNAAVKNNATEARKICVNYEILDDADNIIVHGSRCQVVLPGAEGEIEGDAYAPAKLLKNAKTSRVIPAESHRMYSFVR